MSHLEDLNKEEFTPEELENLLWIEEFLFDCTIGADKRWASASNSVLATVLAAKTAMDFSSLATNWILQLKEDMTPDDGETEDAVKMRAIWPTLFPRYEALIRKFAEDLAVLEQQRHVVYDDGDVLAEAGTGVAPEPSVDPK